MPRLLHKQLVSRSKSPLKKTYLLKIDGKSSDRLLDAAKHDIRKYVKRERAKPLPEGADFWDFECKFGADPAKAQPLHFAALMSAIDAHVTAGGKVFYLELLASHGHRTVKPAQPQQQESPGVDPGTVLNS